MIVYKLTRSNSTESPRVCYGDKVTIKSALKTHNTIIGFGIVKYIGPILKEIASNKHIFYGIDLKKGNTKNNGMMHGIQYFETKSKHPNTALFVQHKQIKNPQKTKQSLQLTIGDWIYCHKVKNTKTRNEQKGIIRYIGIPSFRTIKKPIFGIELLHKKGDTNGTLKDVRYFKCKRNYGIFCKRNQVTKCLNHFEIEDILHKMDRDQQIHRLIVGYLENKVDNKLYRLIEKYYDEAILIEIKQSLLTNTSKADIVSLAINGYIRYNYYKSSIPNEIKRIISDYMKDGKYSEIFVNKRDFIQVFGNNNMYMVSKKPLNDGLSISPLHKFDTSKCVECRNTNCLKFQNAYRCEYYKEQETESYLYLNHPTSVINHIDEYQCKICCYYIGYNLTKKTWSKSSGGPSSSHNNTVTFSPFGSIDENQKFKQMNNPKQCDKCKRDMKCINVEETENIGFRSDNSSYRASWYCEQCQLFCNVSRESWWGN